jgi:hypothetical protein
MRLSSGLGILIIGSTIVFKNVKAGDGGDLSQHNDHHPGG